MQQGRGKAGARFRRSMEVVQGLDAGALSLADSVTIRPGRVDVRACPARVAAVSAGLGGARIRVAGVTVTLVEGGAS